MRIIKSGLPAIALVLTFSISSLQAQVARNSPSSANTDKPNVIIVLTDDQGYGDLSCHGNPILQTPALDKLHNESVRFGDFHATPLCTPTRGQLMTGLDALDNKASTVGRGLALMRRDVITMPEVFNQNGYETGIFGKWHLGDSYPDRPMDRGFQKSVWIKGWGLLSEMEYDNNYYQTRYLDSLETKYSDKYCTDLWVDEAIDWMDKLSDQKQPFFTYLALNAPHGPFDAPEEDYNYYRGKVEDKKTASFFGMIRNMDQNMARLDTWLEKKGIKDNTIIIFMTDNGSAAGAKVFNAGMRGEKGSNYEGGHRVPCFVRWPDGKLGNPRTVTYASQIQDILPTLIDLLDFQVDEQYRFDGESLASILKQEKKAPKDRMFVVQYAGLEEKDLQRKYFSAVVWNSWRLVGENELYDLSKDPGQENNVASANPKVFKKMKSFYDDWWKKLEPAMDEHVPTLVGSKENPVILSPDFWVGGSINTQWKVADGVGNPKGGVWHVDVRQEGEYRIELSRWPFHLDRELTIAGPETAVGGRQINPGKAIPIETGCLALNDNAPVTAKRTQGATKISMEMRLRAGDNRIQAWFKDGEGKDVCGAYYVRVERVR